MTCRLVDSNLVGGDCLRVTNARCRLAAVCLAKQLHKGSLLADLSAQAAAVGMVLADSNEGARRGAVLLAKQLHRGALLTDLSALAVAVRTVLAN